MSIELAKKLNMVSRVIVSTDSNEIARTAEEFGAEAWFLRPLDLVYKAFWILLDVLGGLSILLLKVF